MKSVRGLPLHVLSWILVGVMIGACGAPTESPKPSHEMLSTKTLDAKGETLPDVSATATPNFQPYPQGLILRMHDGYSYDPRREQAIFSFYRLDEDGHLFNLYTPSTRNGRTGGEESTVSPDGEWIVFAQSDPESLQSDLYRMRTDGTCLTRLTDTLTDEGYPAWRPDGKSILYIQTTPEALTLSLNMLMENGAVTELTRFEETTMAQPVWSPDGKWILIFLGNPNGEQRVILFDMETYQQVPVGIDYRVYNGAWSSDSARIAFVTLEGDCYLYEVESDMLNIILSPDGVRFSSVGEWSPSDKKFAVNGQDGEVYLWEEGKPSLQMISEIAGYPLKFLLWSPDSRKMLLEASINGPESDFYQMDLRDGGIYTFDGLKDYLILTGQVLYWGPLPPMPPATAPIATEVGLSMRQASTPIPPAETTTWVSIAGTEVEVTDIRSGPGTLYPVIGEIGVGKAVECRGISVNGDWLQFVYHEKLAWVFAEFTDYNPDGNPLPIVDSPSVPTP